MRGMFGKEMRRTIKGSLGRFVAIAVIAALGAGFYAGLRMTCPDMELASDTYCDGTNASDIRVVSTLGLSDESIEQLSAIEGVEGVMPAYETDVMGLADGKQVVMRVHSLDVGAAKASDTSDGLNAVSADSDYINRSILVDGTWPEHPGECVLSADAVLDSPIEIGDTIELTEGVQNLDDTLDVRELKVVGFVRSSYYTSTTDLGSTSLGGGGIETYAFVAQSDFADGIPWTEAFITVAGAKDLAATGDEYQRAVDAVAQRIEEQSGSIGALRLAEVADEAQDKLDENRAEYEEKRADAESELADAKLQLDSSAETIAQSESQLADAAAQLEAGEAQLSASQSELAAAREQAEAGESELAAKRDEAQAAFAAAQEEIGRNRSAYEQAMAQRAELSAELEKAEAALEALDAVAPLPPELEAQREQLVQGIAALKGGIDEIDRQTAGAAEALEAAEAQLAASREQAEAGFAQARSELDDAWQRISDGEAQLAAGRASLEQGRAEYDAGMSALSEGKAAYDEGLAEYERSKADAEAQFADAESELAEAQRTIDELAAPDIHVLDRSKNLGMESFVADASRIDRIAQVFPLIFFLVAALVSLTTMTRMIEDERVLIGTYKALGYSRARITAKYLAYAAIASGIGSVLGILLMAKVLPGVIMWAYSIVYAVPVSPTPIDLGIAAASVIACMGITLVATWCAAAATLREMPASLMLPRAPKAGKRIFLERIKPLWSRLGFLQKVTARNLVRYKSRFIMTVVGVAGCTALMLTGLGLHDAINDIIDKQFGEIYHYDTVVRLADDMSDEDSAASQALLDDASLVERHTAVQSTTLLASAPNDGRQQYVSLIVPQNPDGFQDGCVTVRNRVSGQDVELAAMGDTAVISEKTSAFYGLEVGDTLLLSEQDAIGNASGQPREVVVGGIMENYVGQCVLMTPTAYESVFGEVPAYTAIYAKAAEGQQARESLSAGLLALDGVKTVGFNDETIDSYRTMLKSVNSIVVVLVVSAMALAFVVLYNLTNINITERMREIATLKVLGFTRNEVMAYIFREVVLLAVIGALVGLGLGVFMEGFVVVTAEVDQVMFGREIHAASFAVAFALTMVFTGIVAFFMRRKLARIDMVESLKSVE